jgi:hypothetical protein
MLNYGPLRYLLRQLVGANTCIVQKQYNQHHMCIHPVAQSTSIAIALGSIGFNGSGRILTFTGLSCP